MAISDKLRQGVDVDVDVDVDGLSVAGIVMYGHNTLLELIDRS